MADVARATAATTDAQLITGSGKLHSFSAQETATVAAAAQFVLRDGTSAAGEVLAYGSVTSDGSCNVSFASPLEFHTGVFLDRTVGETAVAVHVS